MKHICPQCQDRGIYRIGKLTHQGYQETEDIFCENCTIGWEMRRLSERRKSPDWVNPFTNLSDTQIINMINRSVEFEEPNRLIKDDQD